MANNEDYDLDSVESGRVSFDFRGYLFKVLNLWKLVMLSIGSALLIAYFINVRKQNVYKLDSLISVENDQNPFFTANTSISFNWGGVSGKVGTIITAIRTRSHNEKVVDSLQFYKEYLQEGKYRKEDIYTRAPFDFIIDKSKPQGLSTAIGVRFLGADTFEIFTNFEGTSINSQRYGDKSVSRVSVPTGEFTKTFSSGQIIDLPFLNGKIIIKPSLRISPGSEYFLRFKNFDGVVNGYKNRIIIGPFSDASSVLRLQLAGNNKDKIVLEKL